MHLALSQLLLLCFCFFCVVLSSVVVSAQQLGNESSSTTVAPPTPTPPPTQTDPTICDIGYLQNLRFTNYSIQPPVTYIMSISPCNQVPIYPGVDAAGKSTGTTCGVGFAGWTEDKSGLRGLCQNLYNQNSSYNENNRQTKYFDSRDVSQTLTVTWVCTGLEGDVDKTKAVITAVSDDHMTRTVTIQTKGCIRPEDDELRAGVIVAIVVVAVFVLAVIVSVVKAKCFGSGGGNNTSSVGGHFGNAGVKPSHNNHYNNNNVKFSAPASTQGNNEITTNYQAMP